jgi:DNA polymerase III epsilon subunit-like protein
MLRVARTLASRGSVKQSKQSPLDLFLQVQLGLQPPVEAQRQFLVKHFRDELIDRRVTDTKLYSMDSRLTFNLLRELLFNRYLNVPFRLFTFDMEFTSAPNFTATGPTEEIIEIGIYNPARNDTFSSLVKPVSKSVAEETTKLTGITGAMLKKSGRPFLDVWKDVLTFLNTPEPSELPGSGDRILLLSHGGKLADVSMLQWALKAHGMEMPDMFTFGDTFHIVRDLHRRRPVTPDRHPPSWKLGDLVDWLKVPTTAATIHRAADDAKLTWDAVSHTLDRYGDEALTARQQLITRFFDSEAKRSLSVASASGAAATYGVPDPVKDIEDLDFSDIGLH